MKIHNNNINRALNIYNNKANTSKARELERGKKSDELNISSTAHEFQIAMEQIKKQPDVRSEKVEALKKQIESGNYKVDARNIAEKMMRDANLYKKLQI